MMKCTKSRKEKRSAAIRNGLIALAGIVAVFVSGALATSPQAQAIADELKGYRKASEAAIAERLVAGKAAGDWPEGLSAEGLAKYIAGVMNGMSIQARDGASVEELRDLAETALAALPAGKQNQGHDSKTERHTGPLPGV